MGHVPASPVILIKSGNDWTLPSGQSANFFRVRLTEYESPSLT